MRPHRSSPPPTRADLQALLDRGRDAWRPREGERWDAFVRRKSPPEPSLFRPIARARHRQALAAALEGGERRRTGHALLLPAWIGNNEDEEPRGDVWARALLLEGHTEVLREVELADTDPTFWARVELTVIGASFVALGDHYAPGTPVRRFGPFAVVETVVRTVVQQIEACELAAPSPAPTTVVPAFSALVAPAFDAGAVPPDIAEAAAAALARLQFVNEDDEDDEGQGAPR